METLRSIVNWIGNHRIVSIIGLLIIVFGALYLRTMFIKTQGTISDPLKRGAISESVYGIGTVTASRSHQIKSGITSTIFNLYVKEGDVVKKGTKLLNIDGTVYNAPFDGTVTNLPFKERENIFMQTTVLTLVDLRDRYVVVNLEQQGALRVKKGQKAKLSFDTIRQQSYDGEVESVYSNDNNFLARINVGGLPENILPGMTTDVAISIRQHENALLVPVAALEEGKYVWVKRGKSLPQKTEITVGIVDKSMAEVLSGSIQEGDTTLIRKQLNP